MVVAVESPQRVVPARAFEFLGAVAAEDEVVAVGAVDEPVLRLVSNRVRPGAAEDGAPERVAQDGQVVGAQAAFEPRVLLNRWRIENRQRVVALTTVYVRDLARDEVSLANLAVVREVVSDGHGDGIRARVIIDQRRPLQDVCARAAVEPAVVDRAASGELVLARAAVHEGRAERAGQNLDVVVLVVGGDPEPESSLFLDRCCTEAFVGGRSRAPRSRGQRRARVDHVDALRVGRDEDSVRLSGVGVVVEGRAVTGERARLRDARENEQTPGRCERTADCNHRNETPHRANVPKAAAPTTSGAAACSVPLRRLLEREAWLGLDRLARARPARDEEGRDRSRSDEYCADPERGSEPVHVGRRRLVAAVVGEDRGENRYSEHAAELADGVVGAGGLALLLATDAG